MQNICVRTVIKICALGAASIIIETSMLAFRKLFLIVHFYYPYGYNAKTAEGKLLLPKFASISMKATQGIALHSNDNWVQAPPAGGEFEPR